MKYIKKNLLKVFLISSYILLPVVSFAQVTGGAPVNKIKNPLGGTNTIQEFLLVFLKGVIKLGIPVVALAVIYCGFLFVKAQGNAEELTKAKDALLYTLIGAGILLGAIAMTELVINTVKSVAS